MGSWFKRPRKGIDAEAENDACNRRDSTAWAMLMSHMADASTTPMKALAGCRIQGAPHLGFCRETNEVLIYRLVGNPPRPEALIVGHAVSMADEGALKSEAIRRDAM